MTTVGRWSPNKVRKRILDETWVAAGEASGGMSLMMPTSIVSTGTGSSSSITANGSVTFSSCVTLALNGVFTSEYENYMMTMRMSSTGAQSVFLRWRASGTDNMTASSYMYQYMDAAGTSLNASRNTENYTNIVEVAGNLRSGTTVFIYQPQKAATTYYRTTAGEDSGGGKLQNFSGKHNQSTSYDGFSLFTTLGVALTGTISVYGLVGV